MFHVNPLLRLGLFLACSHDLFTLQCTKVVRVAMNAAPDEVAKEMKTHQCGQVPWKRHLEESHQACVSGIFFSGAKTWHPGTRDYNGALDLAGGTLFCAQSFVKVGSKGQSRS